jgi:DNA-binding GntR family transcriptional regulator
MCRFGPGEAVGLAGAGRELRSRILRGELLPGEQLRQEQLAEQLHTRRVPVREALSVLADKGLLTHRKRQGYFATNRSPGGTRPDRPRAHPPGAGAASTIVWPPAQVIEQLRAKNARMTELAGDEAYLDVVPLNREFHPQIFGLSPLNLMLDEVRGLWTLADAFIALDYAVPDRRHLTVSQHERIIEALAARDRARLLEVIHEHRESTGAGARASLKQP